MVIIISSEIELPKEYPDKAPDLTIKGLNQSFIKELLQLISDKLVDKLGMITINKSLFFC